jgi:hypothetical protein
MPAMEALYGTARASRYLVQFCRHAAAMGGPRGHRFRPHAGSPAARGDVAVHCEWTDRRGAVTFDPWGRCVLRAEPHALAVLIEAGTDDDLRRIQQIVTADLDRFSRHTLTATWTAADPGQEASP